MAKNGELVSEKQFHSTKMGQWFRTILSNIYQTSTSTFIVVTVLEALAEYVYQYIINAHSMSPIERLFCLPVGEHQICVSATLEDIEALSFAHVCRQAGESAENEEFKRLLCEIELSEIMIIAKYLEHTRRATIEQGEVQ
jgi:hypothetical protein